MSKRLFPNHDIYISNKAKWKRDSVPCSSSENQADGGFPVGIILGCCIQKREMKDYAGYFKSQSWKCSTLLLQTSYLLELRHSAPANCKEGWEMWFSYVCRKRDMK